jgi:hypothetical protein
VNFASLVLVGTGGIFLHPTRPVLEYEILATSAADFTQHSLSQPVPDLHQVAAAQSGSAPQIAQHPSGDAVLPLLCPLGGDSFPKSVSCKKVQPGLGPFR